MKTKVINMTSSNGNKIANQFEITTDKGVYFQSYATTIAFVPDNKEKSFYEFSEGKSLYSKDLEDYPLVYLDSKFWNYSTTTGKYRNIFLGENRKETERKIMNKTYLLTNLN